MLMVIGASGRTGQLMRDGAGGAPVIWTSRRGGAGLARWRPGDALPPLHGALVLSGVTSGPAEGYGENIRIAREAAQALAAASVPLCLYASTQAVYGRTADGGAAETDLPCAPGAYGVSKLSAERVFLREFQGRSGRAVVLRLGNIAGADRLGRQVAEGRPLRLDRFPGGHGPERSYLAPDCILRLTLGLLQADARGAELPEVMNVAGARPVAMADILAAAGLPFAWRTAPEGAVRRTTLSVARLAGVVPDLMPDSTPQALAAALRPPSRSLR